MGDHYDSRTRSSDDPPNSRLFIVCNKNITEDEFRKSFEKYGNIEEIWSVKDKNTGEPKGIVYIKFSKTSEAALALEEMNGQTLSGHSRPLKVMIAHNRDQGSKREENENDRLLRLFIVVPKSMTDQDVRNIFRQYGDLDYVSVVKDRETKESKGVAYVKYLKMYHAAKAFEECDRSFKAVFARPKESRNPPTSHDSFDRYSSLPTNSADLMSGYGSDSTTHLGALVSSQLSQDQVFRLFDLVPGLDSCRVASDQYGRSASRRINIRYKTSQAAMYALEKLNGFEYPLGKRIVLRPAFEQVSPGDSLLSRGGGVVAGKRDAVELASPSPNTSLLLNLAPDKKISAELASLTKALAAATSIIQAAGLATGGLEGKSETSTSQNDNFDASFCSAQLPPPQPLAPPDSKTEERLFIVCQPSVPPVNTLWDVFSRFGNLIEVYLLNGKNCGYATYAKKESANKAIEVLHGQEVCRMRLKVMQAEPPKSESRKRMKMDEESPSYN